ncbi:MAG: lysophospholipase [Phycisphaerales bacterium]|nr:lysophospholipase [Phycisphaerales bacterium]
MVTEWSIPGSDEFTIHGSTHLPAGDANGVVIIVHGYMGFKEYGMFPWLASQICDQGAIVHRINLSHSGMEHGQGGFNDEAFRRGTWNAAVEDIVRVVGCVQEGVLAGQGKGIILLGHSRGGSSCLLAAGRHGGDPLMQMVCGIVSLSAPASLRRFRDDAWATLESGQPFILRSNRTGQNLHVDPIWLESQLADPAGHDLLAQVGEVIVPIVLIHGSEDATVSASDAVSLASANPGASTVHIIEGADHVFQTPNPFPPDAPASPALQSMWCYLSETLADWFQ